MTQRHLETKPHLLLSALPTQEWLFGRPTIDLKRTGELIGTYERKSSGANCKKSLKLNTLSSGLHLPASSGVGEGWGGTFLSLRDVN